MERHLAGELIPIPGKARVGVSVRNSAHYSGSSLHDVRGTPSWPAGARARRRPALDRRSDTDRRREGPRSAMVPGLFRIAIPLLAVAIAALALGTVNAIRFDAPTQIDFMNTWGLKAKAAFVDGNLDFAHLGHRWLYYPLNVPNLYATTFVIRGQVDESLLRLPGSVFGIALAGVLWGSHGGWCRPLRLPAPWRSRS